MRRALTLDAAERPRSVVRDVVAPTSAGGREQRRAVAPSRIGARRMPRRTRRWSLALDRSRASVSTRRDSGRAVQPADRAGRCSQFDPPAAALAASRSRTECHVASAQQRGVAPPPRMSAAGDLRLARRRAQADTRRAGRCACLAGVAPWRAAGVACATRRRASQTRSRRRCAASAARRCSIPPLIDRLADDVIRRVERRMRIERERRGL